MEVGGDFSQVWMHRGHLKTDREDNIQIYEGNYTEVLLNQQTTSISTLNQSWPSSPFVKGHQ